MRVREYDKLNKKTSKLHNVWSERKWKAFFSNGPDKGTVRCNIPVSCKVY